MLEFKSLYIKNLASIEEQNFIFSNNLNILTGFDLDRAPEELRDYSFEDLLSINKNLIPSNGSGKSTIIEGISLALFGTLLRPKATIREIIRTNQEYCIVELICRNTLLDLEEIKIKRTFFVNKTSKIEVWETNKGNTEEIKYSVSGELDKYILNKYIGISREDIYSYFIVQESRYTPFLMLSDSKKKELLSNLIGIDKYNYIEDKIEENISNSDSDIILKEKEIAKIEGKIEINEENLNNYPNKEEFEKDIKDKIEIINNDIKNSNDKIKKIEEKIESLKDESELNRKLRNHWSERSSKFSNFKENNKYKKELSNLEKKYNDKKIEIEEIEGAIKEANKELNENNKNFNKYSASYNKIKAILDNLIICPNCGHEFDASNYKTRNDVNKELKKSEKDKNSYEEEIKNIEKDIEDIKILQDIKEKESIEIKDRIRLIKNSLKKIDRIGEFISERFDIYFKRQQYILQIEIPNLENQKEGENKIVSQYNKQIDKINEYSFENKIVKEKNLINENINSLKKDKEIIKNTINDIQKSIQLNKDTKIVYKGFQNYLFSKYIFNVEILVNDYLSRFTNLNIKILTKKQLVSKQERDEINVIVLRNKEEISYWTLSSGEKASINVAFIVSFQHFINTSTHNGLNILILDEITSNVDSFNSNDIVKFLNSLNKTILFVSHVALDKNFKQTYIVKKNNTSKIIQF